MKVWNGFDFYFYLDRINQSSLKLRPGTQDYQEFFACGEGLSAGGWAYKKLGFKPSVRQHFRLGSNPVQELPGC